MSIWRWLGYSFLTVFVLAVGAYYWLFVDSRVPSGSYSIDMVEVRKLADTIAGDKPSEIRVERIASFKFPFTAAVAGGGWTETEVPVYSYQVSYGDRFLLIDTAIDGTASKSDPTFDAAAYVRMQKAMEAAFSIVITHEHPDHIGGLVAHPALAKVLDHTYLSQEQHDHPEKMFGLKFPEGALANYQPLNYGRYHALAPGVVLIKAPGHTPGSQIVFVKAAGGQEYMFLGDIAWRFESVERLAARARFVSDYFLEEDRDAVLLQLAELKRIHEAEPQLAMVAGHDISQMSVFLNSGTLTKGFK